jgi:hypothetical protein
MSDLSKVLGDLYGGTDPDGPPTKKEASAQERIQKAQAAVQPEPVKAEPEEDLQTVLNEALATAPKGWSEAAEEAEDWADSLAPVEEHLHQKGALRAWVRTDDDFLPQRGRKWNHRNKHH